MSASLFIVRQWKKQVQVFQQNLALVKKQKQTEAVHDLRVAVKKMRSYLKLLNIARQDNYSLAFDGTEKLFSVMGKYRDIEMGLDLLGRFEKENNTSYKVFSDYLAIALLQQGKWLQAAMLEYDENELTGLTYQLEQDLKDADREELMHKFKIVIEKEFKKAGRHINHFNRDTHQIRKIFKDIFYWVEIAPAGVLMNTDQVKKIKKILNNLGDWQDHEMLHQKIKHFRKDFVPDAKDEYQALKELESNIQGQKEKLLDKAKAIAIF
ncbi:CHAD domain-containing protein [Terrimonas pollutisoli]|uniref:CHAD domain-containing protein n=1 Tax=Terrimonas pollutisoli TaxID=3034147 RepID=UPI0023ED8299|nr:CHAD domain-containing protein [Terrimonas sp. H1YJ31]